MHHGFYARLKNYSTLHFGGADARTFLQGQLSNDIEEQFGDEGWQWSALHLPDGRVFALLLLIARGQELIAVLPREIATTVYERLCMFRMRAKVDIDAGDDEVFGIAGELVGPTGTIRIADNLSIALRGKADAFPDNIGIPPASENDWALQRLRAGIVEINSKTQGRYVGQMLNLDLLPAISFSKGCFIGQEILARTQNLGKIKRRMYRFKSTEDCGVGDRLLGEGDATVGDVVDVAGTEDGVELLAVARHTERDAALTINGAPVQRLPLPYESD